MQCWQLDKQDLCAAHVHQVAATMLHQLWCISVKHSPWLWIQLKYVRGENAEEGVWTINCVRCMENQNHDMEELKTTLDIRTDIRY
jgi:hypothetical protein